MVRWFGRTLTVSIALAGLASAAVAASSDNAAAPTPADKVRCKRYTETGSLAKVRKECHTEAEWRQIADQGRQQARDMVSRTIGAGQAPH